MQYSTHCPGRQLQEIKPSVVLVTKGWPAWKCTRELTYSSISPQTPFPSLLLPGIALPENLMGYKLLPQAPVSGVPGYSRHYESPSNHPCSSYHNSALWPNFPMPTPASLYWRLLLASRVHFAPVNGKLKAPENWSPWKQLQTMTEESWCVKTLDFLPIMWDNTEREFCTGSRDPQ